MSGSPRPMRDQWEESEPVVVVNHGAGWLTEDRFWEMVPRDYAEIMIRATEASIRSADVVIVPSQYTRASLINGMGRDPESVVAVAHGVDTSVFRPRPEAAIETVPAAPGGEIPYVAFASIPSIRQKNLGALKQAIGILAARGLPHTLVIAGGTAGGESEDYLAEIRSDPPGAPGRVAWPGQLDDVALAELMAGAAACCLPSLFESFGLTALESIACGAPTVVSDRGALPEVVGDAGLVTSPDPESLANALERVLLDAELSRRLRAAGPARAAGFSWDRTAAGWLSALRRAAGS